MLKINIIGPFSGRRHSKNFSNKILLDAEEKKSKNVHTGAEWLFQRPQFLHFRIACVLLSFNFWTRVCQFWNTRNSIFQKLHNMTYILVLNKPENVIKKFKDTEIKEYTEPLRPQLAFGHRSNNQSRNIDNKLPFEWLNLHGLLFFIYFQVIPLQLMSIFRKFNYQTNIQIWHGELLQNVIWKVLIYTKVYPKPCQTSKMESFAKINR